GGELLSLFRVVNQHSDLCSKALGVVVVKVAGGIAPEFVKSWNIVQQQGAAGQGCLDGGKPKWLITRGSCINSCLRVEIAQLLPRLRTQPRDTTLAVILRSSGAETLGMFYRSGDIKRN